MHHALFSLFYLDLSQCERQRLLHTCIVVIMHAIYKTCNQSCFFKLLWMVVSKTRDQNFRERDRSHAHLFLHSELLKFLRMLRRSDNLLLKFWAFRTCEMFISVFFWKQMFMVVKFISFCSTSIYRFMSRFSASLTCPNKYLTPIYGKQNNRKYM